MKKWLIGAVILLIGATLSWSYTRSYESKKTQPTQVSYKEVIAEYGSLVIRVAASGVVKPIDRIELKSKASGEIVELAVEMGDSVKRGALIARLDQKDEKAAVAQAQADLDIARAELALAQRNYERRMQLFEDKIIPEEERDQSTLNLAVARGKLVQAQTTLGRAHERLDESVITAPVDGIILQKYVERGQIIASGVSNVGGGTPIADIADMDTVYIEAGIDEIDIGKIAVGQIAQIVAEAYPEQPYQGRVVRIAPEARIEQNVTLFDVIIEVVNADNKLKSGMNISLEIEIQRQQDILLVPVIALQDKKFANASNKRQVLLKQGSDYVPHEVQVGLSNHRDIQILSGLNPDDVLGIPMLSRLKNESDRLEKRIRASRSFGGKKNAGH